MFHSRTDMHTLLSRSSMVSPDSGWMQLNSRPHPAQVCRVRAWQMATSIGARGEMVVN